MLNMASTAAPAHQKLLSNWGISGIILQILIMNVIDLFLQNSSNEQILLQIEHASTWKEYVYSFYPFVIRMPFFVYWNQKNAVLAQS